MRIYNQVGSHTVTGEWHINFRDNQSDSPFLSGARRQFITQIRYANLAKAHFGNPFALLPLRDERFVDNPQLPFFGCFRCVHFLTRLASSHSDKDRFVVYLSALSYKSIIVQFAIIITWFRADYFSVDLYISKLSFATFIAVLRFGHFLVTLIGAVISSIEEPAFEGTFIHQNGIFHIIPTIAHNRNYRVLAIWHFFTIDVFHISGFNERYLTIVQHYRGFVHPHLMIRVIYRTRLFALTT